ncbi:hypothetical protein AGR1B_Cc40068 [Agrobacterium fabacearum S56]|nr:hypothetical protein AGR1C_Cc40330 [Agrobacterium fabacearum TT111]CUW94429.1 hypothetical protein AGR1B_Cc40068 [Agrobacterium fabacearum S56]
MTPEHPGVNIRWLYRYISPRISQISRLQSVVNGRIPE